MAKFILDDADIVVNGVNLSDHCSSVTIDDNSDEQDVTAMGADNKQVLLGVGDGTMTAEFFQDFAAGSVDATLNGLQGSNTPFNVVVKPTSAAVSATNPKYTMSSVLPNYQPLAGAFGAPSKVTAAFRNTGATGIVRATA